ncbi:E3 binding domain-containing protein, partial [Brevibacillus sp. B_LB10_24]|uniref:E3 binding domain-containing protein n=1 Tax=Brevibacillus sp. B_LB10_24 TaxID=3380645 RepID=UPI0038BDA083
MTGTGERGRIHQADVERYLAGNRQAEVKATPLAQKIAAAEGIALGDVEGTGVQGKVRKGDV